MSTDTIWAFRTMIVPADYQSLAQSIASVLGGVAGEDMFLTGLSASGDAPASNYVSTGSIGAQFADLLPLDTYTTEIDPNTGQPVVIHTHKDGDPATVVALYNATTVTEIDPVTGQPVQVPISPQITVAEVTDLFNASDVTEQDPFTAFDRLGLQLVQTPFSP